MLIYKDRKNANRQQAIIGEFVQSNRSKGGYSYTLARFDNDYKYFQNDIEDYINKSNLEDNFKSEVSNSLKKVVIYKFSTEKFLLPYRGFAIKSYSGLSINNIFGNTLYLNYYKKTAWGEYLFEN